MNTEPPKVLAIAFLSVMTILVVCGGCKRDASGLGKSVRDLERLLPATQYAANRDKDYIEYVLGTFDNTYTQNVTFRGPEKNVKHIAIDGLWSKNDETMTRKFVELSASLINEVSGRRGADSIASWLREKLATGGESSFGDVKVNVQHVEQPGQIYVRVEIVPRD